MSVTSIWNDLLPLNQIATKYIRNAINPMSIRLMKLIERIHSLMNGIYASVNLIQFVNAAAD
jgi:hypothetical protein